MDFKNVNRYALNSLAFALIFIVVFRIAKPVDFFTLIRICGMLVLVFFAASVIVDLLSQVIIKKLRKKKQ